MPLSDRVEDVWLPAQSGGMEGEEHKEPGTIGQNKVKIFNGFHGAVNQYGSPADIIEFYIRELALTRLIWELALPVCTFLDLQCLQLKGPT